MHWLKMLFSRKYREATRTADNANKLVSLMLTNKTLEKRAWNDSKEDRKFW